MKKLLCYLGILLLLGLAVLPPALRIFLPDQDRQVVEKNESKSALLSCKNDNYEIITNYENEKVQMLVIKKMKNNNESDLEDDINNQENKEEQDNLIENNKETELDIIFNSLKEASNIIYNELEDGEVIGIDFSIYDHKDLDLGKLTKSPDMQKTYYENQGLTCTIRK